MIDIDTLERPRKIWMLNSGIPSRHLGRTLDDLDDFDEVTETHVKGWLKAVEAGKILTRSSGVESQGSGLTLIGKPGHGKTSLARALLHEIAMRVPYESVQISDVRGRFPRHVVHCASYPAVLEAAKRTYRVEVAPEDETYVDRLYGRGEDPHQVLVIDDLGKEHRTASHWAENFFDSLVRSRWDQGFCTIITANVALKQWAEVYGDAMASFIHEATNPLAVRNPKGDRRIVD